MAVLGIPQLDPGCVRLIDKVPPKCDPIRLKTEKGINRCNSDYYKPAAKCVENFLTGQKKTWHPSVFNANLLFYLSIATAASSSDIGIGYSHNFIRGLRKVFLTSLFHMPKGVPLKHVYWALIEPRKGVSPKIKDVIKYVNTADVTKFLPRGTGWTENKEAALLILISMAISKNDPMKPGWEKKYLKQVVQFFPLQQLKK